MDVWITSRRVMGFPLNEGLSSEPRINAGVSSFFFGQ